MASAAAECMVLHGGHRGDNRSMAQRFNGNDSMASMGFNDDGGSMGCGTPHRGDALASGREPRTARVRCCLQLDVCELRYVMNATRASPGMG